MQEANQQWEPFIKHAICDFTYWMYILAQFGVFTKFPTIFRDRSFMQPDSTVN